MTNLIFESSRSWDLLCDVSTGRMVVSKDISAACPYTPPPTLAPHLTNRTGTLKAESSIGSEEEFGKLRTDYTSSKSENYDNMFMEDVSFSPPAQHSLRPIPLGLRSYQPFRTISARASSGLDSRITFGDLCGWLHVTTRKSTGRQRWAGQLRVLQIVGICRDWARVSPSLTIMLEFVSFRLTPVGSRVGNRPRCVNIGNLYVLFLPPCCQRVLILVCSALKGFPKIARDRCNSWGGYLPSAVEVTAREEFTGRGG